MHCLTTYRCACLSLSVKLANARHLLGNEQRTGVCLETRESLCVGGFKETHFKVLAKAAEAKFIISNALTQGASSATAGQRLGVRLMAALLHRLLLNGDDEWGQQEVTERIGVYGLVRVHEPHDQAVFGPLNSATREL